MKKLGIVIPTYNRKKYLREALDALLPQVMKYRNLISIAVCDNASDDGTEEFMNDYLLYHSDILQYYRHPSNCGAFYNFTFGVKCMDAEYIFLHGDDDVVAPFFIEYILSLLDKYPNISLIHFNYLISSPGMKSLRLAYRNLNNDILTYIYPDGVSFIKNHYDVPSFMSSNVFRKDAWVKGESDNKAEGCYGYEFLYIMYKGCLDNKCLFVGMPLSVQCMSGIGGYASQWAMYSIVGMTRVFERLDIGNGILEGWKSYRITKTKAKVYRNIASVYVDKAFYRKHYKEVSPYLDGTYKAMLFICVYILPSCIIKPIFSIAKKILLPQ